MIAEEDEWPIVIEGDNDHHVVISSSTSTNADNNKSCMPSLLSSCCQKKNNAKNDASSTSSSSSSPPILSVEIPLFLYFFAFGIFTPAQQEFIYSRICLFKYNSNQLLCSQIDSTPSLASEEDAVQADYSTYGTLSSLCIYPAAMLTTIIMGTWCDRFSHRFPLILPHIGSILVSGLYLLYFYVPALNQSLNPVLLGLVSLVTGFSGFTATEIMACSSYISCITTDANRTVRLAVVQATVMLGQTFGYLANAFFFSKGNYLIAFVVQIAVNFYALSSAFVFVPELRKFDEIKQKVSELASGSWCRYLCAPHVTVVEAFRVIFLAKPAEMPAADQRYRLIMLFTYAFAAAVIGILSLQSATYEYLTLQPISISKFLYSIFQMVYTGLVGLALIVVLRWLRLSCLCGIFPLSDAAISIIGCLSRVLGLVAIGFGDFYPAYAPWVYAVVNMFSAYAFASLRSGMSKLTEKCDQGRLFSVVGVVENVCVLLASLGFNALYGLLVSQSANVASNDTTLLALVHGYTFFFVAALNLLPLIMSVWLGYQSIKDWSFHSSLKNNHQQLVSSPSTNNENDNNA